MRVEWVEESTPGVYPDDPEWNLFTASEELQDFTASAGPQREGRMALGNIDTAAHDRSTEAASATVSYRQSQFPVDASGNVQDPIAYPITETASEDYVSLLVVARRDVTGGGNDGAGFREFTVVSGARPVSATIDGDAGDAQPLPQELGLEAERTRTYIVHQPDGAQKLVVKSTDSNDTIDVTLEDEGANTTETLTLPGDADNTVETTSDFDNLDAVEPQGVYGGKLQVGTSDGQSPADIDTQLIQTNSASPSPGLEGVEQDGIDYERGIPALGSGSHASSVPNDGPLFIGTSTTGTPVSVTDERLHTLSLSVERDVSREPKQGTRREEIDVGARSISLDADVAGPYESADQIKKAFISLTPDVTWTFDSGETITLNNLAIVDSPDVVRTAGDTNYIPSVSLEPSGDPAIAINKT
jgi:hypothetical protein